MVHVKKGCCSKYGWCGKSKDYCEIKDINLNLMIAGNKKKVIV